jgi:hypothetical protein
MLSHPGLTNLRCPVCCSIRHIAWCKPSCIISVLSDPLTCLTNMMVEEQVAEPVFNPFQAPYAQRRSAVSYCPGCHETFFTIQLATLDQHTMSPCWLLLLLSAV